MKSLFPFMESNVIPSQTNFSPDSGAVQNLANVRKIEVGFDGVSVDQMVGNPIYDRGDDIDKVGIIQKKLADNAKAVKSKSRYIRALNDNLSKKNIPSMVKK